MKLTGNYPDYGRETFLEKENNSREKLKRIVDMISRRGDQGDQRGIRVYEELH